ncbi:hypothetical protein C7974DRAFT_295464, partial [Boeremia exigua]|uniref:uncharacterized protein n=1 Tax=Boeremia exigua TaxID=749465 RepID=UPI001E8DC6C8
TNLTHNEAFYVHHYTKHLSYSLDCTDAMPQFILKIPTELEHCCILRYAVFACAARHRGDNKSAEHVHQRCIKLLVRRLGKTPMTHHNKLLCAIDILCIYEQL